MDKDKFFELEYQTLRREIEQTKECIFKIIVGGTTIVPAAQFIAVAYKVKILILLLPLLVIIIILLFLSENNSLMRCGRYIRMELEPLVPDILGWETWLEIPNNQFDPRLVDKYVVYSFYLLSEVYYAISVYLAADFAQETYGIIGVSVILGIYIALGVWISIFLVQRSRTATMTKFDR